MQLSHLGAKYTVTSRSIETVETDIECSFLGNITKLRVPKHMPTQQAQHTLKYRGTSYKA